MLKYFLLVILALCPPAYGTQNEDETAINRHKKSVGLLMTPDAIKSHMECVRTMSKEGSSASFLKLILGDDSGKSAALFLRKFSALYKKYIGPKKTNPAVDNLLSVNTYNTLIMAHYSYYAHRAMRITDDELELSMQPLRTAFIRLLEGKIYGKSLFVLGDPEGTLIPLDQVKTDLAWLYIPTPREEKISEKARLKVFTSFCQQ